MESTLAVQGINLMLYGMGTVFVFLALLVVSIMLMSLFTTRYIAVYFPEKSDKYQTIPAVEDGQIDRHVIKIIEEAIRVHRKAKK